MGEIIKQKPDFPKDVISSSTEKMNGTTKEQIANNRRRVIKSNETIYSSTQKKIPNMYVVSGEPVMDLIKKDDAIVGLEITCSCGEKIVVQFEY